ncbi:MAG: hypothetical protein IJT05_02185 [Lachnospiraceae bacterium]|nr:hypothetical protein [Lachnospiraceae bacterium]
MLTKEQCEELESKVLSKHDGVTDAETYALIATIIHTTIETLVEYEKIKKQ